MPLVLSVSGTSIDADCRNVVDVMKRIGVSGDVTTNTSVHKKVAEPGCRILVLGDSASCKQLWLALAKDLNLACAHVSDTVRQTSGCVHDVFAPSACPDKVGNSTAK